MALALEEKIKGFCLDLRKKIVIVYCTLHYTLASFLAALFLGSDVFSRAENVLGSSGDGIFIHTLITFYYHFTLS